MNPGQNNETAGCRPHDGTDCLSLKPHDMHTLPQDRVRYETTVHDLLERESGIVEQRRILQQRASTLHVALVPSTHYDAEAPRFSPGKPSLKLWRHYHMQGGYSGALFGRCEKGWEVRDSRCDEYQATSRLFLGDDWLVHLTAAHPLAARRGHGQLNLHEFRETLTRYVSDLLDFLSKEGVLGPFCLMMRVDNLHSSEGLRAHFPDTWVKAMSRPAFGDRQAIEEAIQAFFDGLADCSISGRACNSMG